jgi:hypothetical protein
MNNYEILRIDDRLYKIKSTQIGGCSLCDMYKNSECKPRDKLPKLCYYVSIISNLHYPGERLYFKRIPNLNLFLVT